MCSRGNAHSQPSSARSSSHSSGSQYALCTLGVGLVALGLVMIVWTFVPSEVARNDSNSTMPDEGMLDNKGKTSSVAFVLVGAGTATLLLAICLAVRSKRQQQQHRETQANNAPYMNYIPGEQAESSEEPGPNYDVPTYEEAVTSGQYPVRQSNLRLSTSQLPSYEDLVGAVENDGESREASQPPPAAAVGSAPSRHSSRSSRILRPLRVRRIKSEKLHLKDVRLNIRGPSQAEPITIEPLTPPPQYEDKIPEFSVTN